MAQCSESTGTISAPGVARAACTTGPPAISDSLLAKASRRPDRVAIADADLASELAARVPPGCAVLAGPAALAEIARGADVVVNGVVGFAGLGVTLAALNDGRRLALANKESLIAGGPVVQAARTTPGAEIVPVDSEHCAVHQCLRAVLGADAMAALPTLPASAPLARVVLTASGGPFRGRKAQELAERGRTGRRRSAGACRGGTAGRWSTRRPTRPCRG